MIVNVADTSIFIVSGFLPFFSGVMGSTKVWSPNVQQHSFPWEALCAVNLTFEG